MRYGIALNNRGPSVTAESIITRAQWADRLGYATAWVSDHVVIPVQVTSQYPYGPPGSFDQRRQNFYEAFTTLTYVAGATRGIRLATSVLVVPQREPVLMGKMFATLDALSGGRLVIGAGVGWLREEFEALGAGGRFAVRGAAVEECIQIWKALWTQEISSFQGRCYTLPPVRAFPKPVQRPHPPILIGGNTRPALRRAARLGNGWHAIGLSPDELRAAIAELRALVHAAGRQPEDVPVSLRIVVRLGEPARGPAELAGPANEMRAQLATLEEIGVSELSLDFTDFHAPAPQGFSVEVMERFAELVGLAARR